MCAEIKQEISQKVTNPLVDLTEIKDAAVDEVSSLLLHTLIKHFFIPCSCDSILYELFFHLHSFLTSI